MTAQQNRAVGWDHLICDYPVPRPQRALIPAVPGVYVFLTRDSLVVYVGVTWTSLRRRLTTKHEVMSQYLDRPTYGDLGAIWWLPLPGATISDLYDREKRLYQHYETWWNQGNKSIREWMDRHGYTEWPEPRPWHGADIDHPGDCATWARDGGAQDADGTSAGDVA